MAVVVRVGYGNPFDDDEPLYFNGGEARVFFLLAADTKDGPWLLLDKRQGFRGLQGIGVDCLLNCDYVLQSKENGDFSLYKGDGPSVHIEADEAARLYAWLPQTELIAGLGARSRVSALA